MAEVAMASDAGRVRVPGSYTQIEELEDEIIIDVRKLIDDGTLTTQRICLFCTMIYEP